MATGPVDLDTGQPVAKILVGDPQIALEELMNVGSDKCYARAGVLWRHVGIPSLHALCCGKLEVCHDWKNESGLARRPILVPVEVAREPPLGDLLSRRVTRKWTAAWATSLASLSR